MKHLRQKICRLTALKPAGRISTAVTAALSLAAVVLFSCAAVAAEPTKQGTFLSPQQAIEALVAAVQSDGDDALLEVFGPGSESLIASGDPVADQTGRARFLKAYGEKNALEMETEDRAVLIIGARDYPFPIPIVRRAESWSFDTPAGMDEIINRRIGRNELHTIEVMQVYCDAQREYASAQRNGNGLQFAQKLKSSEGRMDGLYWPVEENNAESPLGPLIAKAADEGYTEGLDDDHPEPFHGYFFKILTAQGEHADGGAFDYLAEGKMVLGFALVAYPARYAVSGIMTFIVNQQGVIFEQDLGEDTTAIAAAMTAYDPDDSWHQYTEPGEP